MSRPPLSLAILCAVLTGLSGCGPQRDERGSPTATATQTPPPAVSASPSASIIRPDIVPQPVVKLPPPPLTLTVGFPDGGSRLDAAAEQALAHVLDSEQFAEGWPIVLRGHSDSAGGDGVNLDVSRKRAQAVAQWLRAHDVPQDRIAIIAFGEQNPIAPNANADGTPNEAGRAKNRRVEIRVAPPQPIAGETGDPTKEDSDGA